MSETPDTATLIARLDKWIQPQLNTTTEFGIASNETLSEAFRLLREAREVLVAMQKMLEDGAFDEATLKYYGHRAVPNMTMKLLVQRAEQAEAQLREAEARVRELESKHDLDRDMAADRLAEMLIALYGAAVSCGDTAVKAGGHPGDECSRQFSEAIIEWDIARRAATDEALARLIAACADEGHEGTQTHCSICRTLMEIKALRTGEGGGGDD